MTKKIYYILPLLVTLLLGACTDTAFDDDSQQLVPLTIDAQAGETRTSLSEGAVQWTEGDEIAVYDFKASKHQFAGNITDGATRFVGQITAKTESFAAIYPYDLASETAASFSTLSATLPTEQYMLADGFPAGQNISVAKGKRNIDGSPSSVMFYNVCQLLRFTVPAYAANKVKSITFTAPTAVAGKLNIDYAGDLPIVSIASSESKTITMLPPRGATTFAAGTYYLLTAPVQLEGFSMTMRTSDEKTYRLASSTTFGGQAGRIYSLGNIDLVNTPAISVAHVYDNGVLQGTRVILTGAPIEGQAWTATIKNSSGTTVRTLSGIGDLTSNESDASWPYLPTGNYTVAYSYTTSNEKTITKTVPNFNFTEKPRFGLTLTAYTSFSYYKGDGVDKNIVTANGLDPMTIYEPKATITGVAERILTNSKYTFNATNTFNGSLNSSSKGVYTYKNYTVSKYQAYTLSATVAFDGTNSSASKTLHITGLPYKAAPPTSSDWSGSPNKWNSDYVRMHNNTISKSFYAPEDMSVTVRQNVAVRRATVGTTYTLTCSGTELSKIEPGYMTTQEDGSSFPTTLTAANPTISCDNSYGNPATLFDEGTHAKIYSIIVQYR